MDLRWNPHPQKSSGFPIGKTKKSREQLQENQDPPGEYEKKWKRRSLWVQSSVVILKKIEKVIDYTTLVGSYCSIFLRVSIYTRFAAFEFDPQKNIRYSSHSYISN